MLIMDAIELPLPTSAINSKVVSPNLSSRTVGSSEIRVSDGADASISVRNRDSAFTSSCTDTKFPSPAPHKKTEFQIPSKTGTPIPASISRRKYTNNEPTTGMILSLPKQDSKTLNPKRSVKLINILPPPSSNKRTKVEQQLEGPVSADSEESARSLKRGRCEGKRERGERRVVRGGNVRAKCELVNCDSALAGSSILGMYGLKIDTHDITKNTEEPPLKDLLEGSRTFYRHSSTSRDNKGKKSVCSKEEPVLSIRKAYSLLLVRTGNKNINKDSDDSKVKCCDKPLLLCKNSSQMNPKEVLDRLSLNQDQNLNSILISTNSNPLPALNSVSLPAFHWSAAPQSGPHKPGFDSVRLPWVRVGGNLTSQQESDGNKIGCGLLDYLEELEKEDEKLKGLNCTNNNNNKEDASRRGEMSHETASVSGQTIEASKQGNDYSARVVQAAEILCELSRISNFQTTSQKQTNGAIKWPNSPSLKTMKPSKPLPPFNKHENNYTNNTNTTNNNSNASNPFPSRNLDYSPSRSLSSHSHQSSKLQNKLPTPIDRKKHDNHNNNNNNNSSKGSIKWPIPTFSTDPKQQQLKGGNDKRPQNSSNYSSQARLERDYENQQRIRKATLTAASLTGNSNPGNSNSGNSNPGNSGPCFGDWKRNKRG